MPGLGKSGTSRMSCLRSIVSRSFSYNTAAGPTSWLICDTRVQSGGFVKLFAVKRFAVVALAGLGLLPAQPAAPQIPKIKFSDNRLDNGLRVIIAEDHYAPVYAICVAYKVGSKDEHPGRTGFAHLFEHMMFKGSENVGVGELDFLIDTNGGNSNGTTNTDRTSYFEVLPKNQLDLGLFRSERVGERGCRRAGFSDRHQRRQLQRDHQHRSHFLLRGVAQEPARPGVVPGSRPHARPGDYEGESGEPAAGGEGRAAPEQRQPGVRADIRKAGRVDLRQLRLSPPGDRVDGRSGCGFRS